MTEEKLTPQSIAEEINSFGGPDAPGLATWKIVEMIETLLNQKEDKITIPRVPPKDREIIGEGVTGEPVFPSDQVIHEYKPPPPLPPPKRKSFKERLSEKSKKDISILRNYVNPPKETGT